MSRAKEQWLPVPGYERHYEVSNYGSVRRIAKGKGARVGWILKGGHSGNGYRTVNLVVEGKGKTYHLHSLVALAFLGPVPRLHEVNHIDGNRTNNRLGNLEYVTRQENIAHKVGVLGTQVRGESHGKTTLTDRKVRYIRKQYPSKTMQILADELDVSLATIHNVIKRKTWAHVA